MMNNRQKIFRESALKHYMQKQKRDVLPHLVIPPAFIGYWILLVLLLIAACLAWWGEVPTYTMGTAVIVNKKIPTVPGRYEAIIVIFLPANRHLMLQTGSLVQLQISAAGPRLTAQVEEVGAEAIKAIKGYSLDINVTQVIPQPSVALIAKISTPLPAHLSAGSIMHIQMQSGSQRLLSLLPGFDGLVGG